MIVIVTNRKGTRNLTFIIQTFDAQSTLFQKNMNEMKDGHP